MNVSDPLPANTPTVVAAMMATARRTTTNRRSLRGLFGPTGSKGFSRGVPVPIGTNPPPVNERVVRVPRVVAVRCHTADGSGTDTDPARVVAVETLAPAPEEPPEAPNCRSVGAEQSGADRRGRCETYRPAAPCWDWPKVEELDLLRPSLTRNVHRQLAVSSSGVGKGRGVVCGRLDQPRRI